MRESPQPLFQPAAPSACDSNFCSTHLSAAKVEPIRKNTRINKKNAKKLACAAENSWSSILSMDLKNFGKFFRESFEAQIIMFPNMIDESILSIIEKYKDKALGWKLSGAGGGGYLIFVSEKNIDGAMQIKIRRRE